jgi:hypothetical protein
MFHKIIVLFFVVFGLNSIYAQKNFTLYNLKGTPQAFYVNPSFTPKSKLYLSIPTGFINVGATNSGFSFNELFVKRDDDSLAINTQGVVEGLKKNNFFSIESQLEVFGLGFKLNDMYLNFSVSNKFQMNITYPKDLMQFALEGNGKSFIGERASFDGLGVNLNSYMEYAFGASKEFGEKLNLGARVKFISGIANVNTKKTEIGLYTDPESFALTLDGEAEIQSANSLYYLDSTANLDQKNIIDNSLKFANKGMGFDFGATYKLNDKISLNASIIDLGFISWQTNVSNYKTDKINFLFEGLNINELVNDSTADPATRFEDTLTKIFNYEVNDEKYRTSLNTKIYLGANYQLTKQLNAGALLFNEFIKGRYRAGFSLSMNMSLRSWLATSLNYTIYNGSFSNIGFGLSIKGGPVQFFVMSDNILSLIKPFDARNVHLCGGLSLSINSKNKKKKDEKIESLKKQIK